MKYRIGIDPGIGGAIARLDDHDLNLCGLADMPIMALGKGKNQVNSAELKRILSFFSSYNSGIAYLEMVSAMPGQGVSGMFNFGVSYGIVQGILAALEIPMILVRPVVWKKRAGLLKADKDRARTLAQQLYPMAELGLKKHVGRADAILIARFGGE